MAVTQGPTSLHRRARLGKQSWADRAQLRPPKYVFGEVNAGVLPRA